MAGEKLFLVKMTLYWFFFIFNKLFKKNYF